jgi:trehalose synthase
MGRVAPLTSVPVPRRPVAQLERIVDPDRYARLLAGAGRLRERLDGTTVWNVNSTATGGGVAEMLPALLGYVDDLGIPARWLVIDGDPEFFAITKRLHNQIHGRVGADGPLGAAESAHYARVLAGNATGLLARVRPGDVVILHDPQTAGLTDALVDAGASVVWRCHIGVDRADEVSTAAWEFLRPYLGRAHAYVFSRRAYVPTWVPEERVRVIPPSIDPFSAKNQDLDPRTVRAVLATVGLLDGPVPAEPARFVRGDGTTGEVRRAAAVVGEGRPGPDDPVVVQVSRWDRLKDMAGVMQGFADHVVPTGPGYLMLVGPAVDEVDDDPEGAEVYGECLKRWHALPAPARERILLVTLPMDDVDENGAMVNALQRYAAVIVQKSLAEGFGLTVAEGMWKGRPVVGSAVGGILDQVVDGTGVLLADPGDLGAFGAAVRALLDDPAGMARTGTAARAHVRDAFLPDLHLLRYGDLLTSLRS